MRFTYTEPDGAGNSYREQYEKGILNVMEKRRRELDERRMAGHADILRDPEPWREKLRLLLGWPLTGERSGLPSYTEEFVTENEGIRIDRTVFEVMPGLPAYGMLFRHTDDRIRPLVFSLHGGMGSPELSGGVMERGTTNYNDLVERFLSGGANVFAPQLLLWDPALHAMNDARTADQIRLVTDTRLQLMGGSITALEIYCMQRELDLFCTMPWVDPDRIGIGGLSYGGFYSLYTAAVETRFKAALVSCDFSDRFTYCSTDYVWKGAAESITDAEAALLIHPRKLIVQMADEDQLTDIEVAKHEAERVGADGEDWFSFHVFHGVHEFSPEDDDVTGFLDALR